METLIKKFEALTTDDSYELSNQFAGLKLDFDKDIEILVTMAVRIKITRKRQPRKIPPKIHMTRSRTRALGIKMGTK